MNLINAIRNDSTAVRILGVRESGDYSEVKFLKPAAKKGLKAWSLKAFTHSDSQSEDVRVPNANYRKAKSQNQATSTLKACLKLEALKVYMYTLLYCVIHGVTVMSF